jgi:hypothetical protein
MPRGKEHPSAGRILKDPMSEMLIALLFIITAQG